MLKIKMIAGLALVTIVLIVISSTALAAPNTESYSAEITATPTASPVGTVQSPTPTPTSAEIAQNPVGEVIASFFGLDYSVVEGFHQDGTGYGVIAQACWMSFELKGDASACADILAAKKSGDYSAIVLPDGTTATNWGQFKKAVSAHKGPGQTLGAIVSGHAIPISTPTPEVSPSPEPSSGPSTFTQPGNGNGNPGNGNPGFGNGNGNGKHHEKGNNNGKGPKR